MDGYLKKVNNMEKPINAFPGYEFKYNEKKKQMDNWYRGVFLGLGGWVYTEPGIYSNVALLDVASLHPSSIVLLNKLGKYTQRYADLRKARVFIKHGDYESAGELFEGKLKKYLTDKESAQALSAALKLPLNAFFGQSFATFENPARDSRDRNNIIALRGALFMKTLFDEVVAKGYKIVHVKTDSVKVVDADLSIIQFIQEFSRKYGYEIEHEATYDRMCLIDKAQYIAAYMKEADCQTLYGYIPSDNAKQFRKHGHPWTATGDKFQHPYIFKTLFSGESIVYDDYCELKTVKDAAIYLDMNEKLPDVQLYEKEITRRKHNEEKPDDILKLNKDFKEMTDDEIKEKIKEGHDYKFVGRTGRFVPIKKGSSGGTMLVYRREKYDSVNGTKGYRWLEAEVVKELHKEHDIDMEYFNDLIDDRIDAINEFGDFERFIDVSKPYIPPEPEVKEEPKAKDISATEDDDPPWSDLPPVVPCGDGKYNTCLECPHCLGDTCDAGYSLCVYQNMEVHDP